MNTSELKKLYGRLKKIKEQIFNEDEVPTYLRDDYNDTVDWISELVNKDLYSFKFGDLDETVSTKLGRCYNTKVLRPKIEQLLGFLEYGYNLSDSVVEIGTLYNSITDEELKNRCADILTAKSNFDRVINQATQVLEDRIRKKSGTTESLTGVTLVNQVLKTDPSKTILIVSKDKDEHEGICHICRGVMQAFRNPTHHYITNKYTREEALKVCAFIDDILRLIDDAKLKE